MGSVRVAQSRHRGWHNFVTVSHSADHFAWMPGPRAWRTSGYLHRLDAKTHVLLVGAGGVGRAIGVALALAGVGFLGVENRTRANADALAQTARRAAPRCVVESRSGFDPAEFDIVVNATSLGLNGEGPMPIDIYQLSGTALVAEVVMVPEVTPMLHAAQDRGLAVVRGLEMLTQQVETLGDFWGMTN